MTDHPDQRCDMTGCHEIASYVYIGEAGDYYLCGKHYRPAPGWRLINSGDPLGYHDPELSKGDRW